MENIALIESFSEFKDDKLIDRVTLSINLSSLNSEKDSINAIFSIK